MEQKRPRTRAFVAPHAEPFANHSPSLSGGQLAEYRTVQGRSVHREFCAKTSPCRAAGRTHSLIRFVQSCMDCHPRFGRRDTFNGCEPARARGAHGGFKHAWPRGGAGCEGQPAMPRPWPLEATQGFTRRPPGVGDRHQRALRLVVVGRRSRAGHRGTRRSGGPGSLDRQGLLLSPATPEVAPCCLPTRSAQPRLRPRWMHPRPVRRRGSTFARASR